MNNKQNQTLDDGTSFSFAAAFFYPFYSFLLSYSLIILPISSVFLSFLFFYSHPWPILWNLLLSNHHIIAYFIKLYPNTSKKKSNNKKMEAKHIHKQWIKRQYKLVKEKGTSVNLMYTQTPMHEKWCVVLRKMKQNKWSMEKVWRAKVKKKKTTNKPHIL